MNINYGIKRKFYLTLSKSYNNCYKFIDILNIIGIEFLTIYALSLVNLF